MSSSLSCLVIPRGFKNREQGRTIDLRQITFYRVHLLVGVSTMIDKLLLATRMLVLLAGLCLSHWAQAQNAVDTDVDEDTVRAAPEPSRDLEEILVLTERSFIALRYQIRREEESLYDLFNTYNSDDDFDITCRLIRGVSHIPQRECEPRFLTRARRMNSIMGLANLRSGFSGGDLESGGGADLAFERGVNDLASAKELAEQEGNKFEVMNLEMLRLALENEEYRDTLMRIAALKEALIRKREERWGK